MESSLGRLADRGPLAAPSLLGRCLGGRYCVEALLADGRHAVYRAEDLALRRAVVLKVVDLLAPDGDGRAARLAAEGRLHGRLQHPAIPALLDWVELGSLRALVIEHVSGVDLDELLAGLRCPMDAGRLKSLLRPVLSALAYLHALGVVHRDVKPANILVEERGPREVVKLADLGVASVIAAHRSWPEAAAARGAGPIGTLLYMAPEHWTRGVVVDERADLYSLGVTVYQMATGAVPFFSRSREAVRQAHLAAPPVSPRRLNPEVSPELERVILRALEKDPARRYQSAEQLAAALAEVPEPAPARPAPVTLRAD